MTDWHPLDADEAKPIEVVMEEIPIDNSDVSKEDIFKLMSGELKHRDIQYRRDRIAASDPTNLKNFLKTIPTVVLLDDFRRMSISGNNGMYVPVPNKNRSVEIYYDDSNFLALIKEELGTREHINNKSEAKVQRRKMAQASRGQRKNKNR